MKLLLFASALVFLHEINAQSCSYNLKNPLKCHLACRYYKGTLDDLLQHEYIQDFTHEICGTNVQYWQIQHITLLENNIDTIHKIAFKNYPNLEDLDLTNNNISYLNDTFKFTKKLKVINLSENSIRHLNVRLISHLKNLKVLNLTGNPLDECDKGTQEVLNYCDSKSINTYYTRKGCTGNFIKDIINLYKSVVNYVVYGCVAYIIIYVYRNYNRPPPHQD